MGSSPTSPTSSNPRDEKGAAGSTPAGATDTRKAVVYFGGLWKKESLSGAIAWWIVDENDTILKQEATRVSASIASKNELDFLALLHALKFAAYQLQLRNIVIKGDNQVALTYFTNNGKSSSLPYFQSLFTESILSICDEINQVLNCFAVKDMVIVSTENNYYVSMLADRKLAEYEDGAGERNSSSSSSVRNLLEDDKADRGVIGLSRLNSLQSQSQQMLPGVSGKYSNGSIAGSSLLNPASTSVANGYLNNTSGIGGSIKVNPVFYPAISREGSTMSRESSFSEPWSPPKMIKENSMELYPFSMYDTAKDTDADNVDPFYGPPLKSNSYRSTGASTATTSASSNMPSLGSGLLGSFFNNSFGRGFGSGSGSGSLAEIPGAGGLEPTSAPPVRANKLLQGLVGFHSSSSRSLGLPSLAEHLQPIGEVDEQLQDQLSQCSISRPSAGSSKGDVSFHTDHSSSHYHVPAASSLSVPAALSEEDIVQDLL